MKLYLLFFLFSFVSTQSYEKFIKVAVGPTTITCNNNNVFVTNDTKYWNCNQKESCQIRNHNVFYVCVKEKFARENCLELTSNATISQDGCFFGNFWNKVEFHIINKYTKFVHFVVLEMSFASNDTLSDEKHCFAFCYQRLDQEFWMSVNRKGWILVKVSNNSKEDFREFFSNSTSLPSRKESDNTTPIEDSSSATKESDDTATIEDSSSATKVGLILSAVVNLLLIIFLVTYCFYRKNLPKAKITENSNGIPLRNNGTFNQIPSGRESDNHLYSSLYGINQLDERTQPKTLISPSQTNKPAQNCEGAFYANVTKQKDGVVTNRKDLPKAKKTENSKDIPSSENGTFNQIPSCRESENHLYSSLYGINQLDERTQPKTLISPSQTNKPAQNCEGAFYANVTKQKDGVVTNRKNLPKAKKTENSNGILLRKNGMFNQMPSGRESENPQYMSMYGINQLEERSQLETPRSPSQTNKPAQNCEDAFYANVTKQDGGPVTAGGQSHVVVNGDLYPTVNKDESYYENSARLDNLARE